MSPDCSDQAAASEHNETKCRLFTILPLEIRELIYAHTRGSQTLRVKHRSDPPTRRHSVHFGQIDGLTVAPRHVCRKLKTELDAYEALDVSHIWLRVGPDFLECKPHIDYLDLLYPRFGRYSDIQQIEVSFPWFMTQVALIGHTFRLYAILAAALFPRLRKFRAFFLYELNDIEGHNALAGATDIDDPQQLMSRTDPGTVDHIEFEAFLLLSDWSSSPLPSRLTAEERDQPRIEEREVIEYVAVVAPRTWPAEFTWYGLDLQQIKSQWYRREFKFKDDGSMDGCWKKRGPAIYSPGVKSCMYDRLGDD